MNLAELYTIKLAEEASEVAKEALKSLQFGLDTVEPGQALTNRQRLHTELDHLLAVVEVLNTDYNLGFTSCPERKTFKKAKLIHYANVSRSCGCLDPEFPDK